MAPTMEGKTKQLSPLAGAEHQLRVVFKDDATAFNGGKHQVFPGKGVLNAKISALLFTLLNDQEISTCFVGSGDTPNELIYEQLTMVPIEVIVRNQAYGSFIKRYPTFSEGQQLPQPVVEFFWKNDAAGDPVLTEDAIAALGLLPHGLPLYALREKAWQINMVFQQVFGAAGIECADFKLEFGQSAQGRWMVADELSPDNFRLRDAKTGAILDKDVFRLDKGDLLEAYETVWQRLSALDLAQVLGASPQQKASEEGAMNVYRAVLQVSRRPGILHPEGRTIQQALHSLGYNEVKYLETGKWFVVVLTASSWDAAYGQATAMAEELLSNPVIEDVDVVRLDAVLNPPCGVEVSVQPQVLEAV